tara:strand:+ start:699 stop:1286 length:588 start_codon:yes stop_codon:yes gene_type:complete
MEFYNKNYKEFSSTRNSIWDCVKEFSNKFNEDSYVLDAGCGNGKNMIYLKKKLKNIIGIDNCLGFVQHCNSKNLNVIHRDIRNLKFKENSFDFIICIAVIHHLKTENERIDCINNLLKILKPNGQLLFTSWAYESDKYSTKKKFKVGNNIVKFNNKERYYYIYNETLFNEFCSKINYTKKIFWDNGNWNVIIKKN